LSCQIEYDHFARPRSSDLRTMIKGHIRRGITRTWLSADTLPLRLPTLIVPEPGVLPVTVASVLAPVTEKILESLECQKRVGLGSSPSGPKALAVAVHDSPTTTLEHLSTSITLMSPLLGPMGEESSHPTDVSDVITTANRAVRR